MQTGFRFRCYPTRTQAQVLRRWIGCQRHIYNAKVQEDRYFRRFQRRFVGCAGMRAPIDQKYAQFIGEETAWLREVPAQVLRNGAVRWRQAYARHFARLAGRPTIKKKHGPQSVWLTAELFRFDDADKDARLHLGTRRHPLGELAYKAHREHGHPSSITVTLDAGRWFVSFTCEDGVAQPTSEEVAEWLATFDEMDLAERTVGLDRGVAIPVCAGDGRQFDYTPAQKRRMARKERAKVRWQRRFARRAKGSQGRERARRRVAAYARYSRAVRQEFAHQTSHALVSDPRVLLLVFEALGVQRMTRRPKARRDAQGRWEKNGAAAKAGLNRGILHSAWGRTRDFARYKARRAGKLLVEVPPHHTSQECAQCGHTHPDNRPERAAFVCQACGHADHADRNAGRVLVRRGVAFIRSGAYREAERKRTMRLRSKVGPERSEPARAFSPAPTPMETLVSRGGGNTAAHGSRKSETPATSSEL